MLEMRARGWCKLGIRSRVDLARIALEHAQPETARTP